MQIYIFLYFLIFLDLYLFKEDLIDCIFMLLNANMTLCFLQHCMLVGQFLNTEKMSFYSLAMSGI